MLYKKILVPYDGSKPADKALQHAVSIAKTSKGSQIIILHIIKDIPRPPYFQYEPEGITGKTSAQHLKEIYYEMKVGIEKMLAAKKKKHESSGINITTNVSLGKASDKIVEFIKSEKIDLVVLGTTGVSGISRIKTLGSVARNVSERASCPVLLIH